MKSSFFYSQLLKLVESSRESIKEPPAQRRFVDKTARGLTEGITQGARLTPNIPPHCCVHIFHFAFPFSFVLSTNSPANFQRATVVLVGSQESVVLIGISSGLSLVLLPFIGILMLSRCLMAFVSFNLLYNLFYEC